MNKIALKVQHYGINNLLPTLNEVVSEDFRNGKEHSFNSLKELHNFITTFCIPGNYAYLFDSCTIDTDYIIDPDEDNCMIFCIDIDYD